MFGIYLKIARRNVVRQFRDYSVYFLTLALASCLLYSFTASGDYLLALDLTEQQRGIYGATSSVMQAFSVFSVLVFLFLVVYANRFILRRRSREFALYGLLGLSSSRTMRILIYESCMVGLVALVVGVGAGVLLSPVFGGVAAFVFAVPWSFVITCSADAALWTAGCFIVIMAGAGRTRPTQANASAAHDCRKHPRKTAWSKRAYAQPSGNLGLYPARSCLGNVHCAADHLRCVHSSTRYCRCVRHGDALSYLGRHSITPRSTQSEAIPAWTSLLCHSSS